MSALGQERAFVRDRLKSAWPSSADASALRLEQPRWATCRHFGGPNKTSKDRRSIPTTDIYRSEVRPVLTDAVHVRC